LNGHGFLWSGATGKAGVVWFLIELPSSEAKEKARRHTPVCRFDGQQESPERAQAETV